MSSSKCVNCGFVSLVPVATCPKCRMRIGADHADSVNATQPIHQSSSTPRVPVYGLPPCSSANSGPAPGTGIWRRGSILAFHKSATLPDRCINCNEPAHGDRVDKKLYWHHPALYLLIFAGLLIYAIVAIVVRKSARVSLGFCQLHKSRRIRLLAVGWLLFAMSLLAFFAAMAGGSASGYVALLGLTLLMAAVVLSLLGGRFIKVTRIDDHFVYLKGVHPAYLDELPPI